MNMNSSNALQNANSALNPKSNVPNAMFLSLERTALLGVIVWLGTMMKMEL